MRSAKSFFNGAIARSDLRRYWPVLFLYVGLWLLFLPIPVWNRAAERNPALVNLTELCADTYATAVVLALMQTPAPLVVPVLSPVMPLYRRRSLLVFTSWVWPFRRLSVQMPV